MDNSSNKLEASFSTLLLSIGSSAMMALGLAPDPNSGMTEKNLPMARFNIDLLEILRDKTRNNLTSEEEHFLQSMLQDLKLKCVQEDS